MSQAVSALNLEIPIRKSRIRMLFLDGIRGLAALEVVISHATNFAIGKQVSPLIRLVIVIGSYGHYAVVVFIVLSGYCLMMPVMNSPDKSIGNFTAYIKRRARRIIPPYYVSLALSILYLTIANSYRGIPMSDAHDLWTTGNIISHLLLVHNFSSSWVYRINPPMWSVATEWQIYFLFPILLLPVWKRFGNIAAIAVGLTIGLIPFYFLPGRINLSWASPWFPGLFAMGMAAAALTLGYESTEPHWRKIWTSAYTPIILFIMALVLQKRHIPIPVWAADALTGAMCASFICWCAKFTAPSIISGQRPFIVRMLESVWALRLGSISYSLYLTHSLVLSGLLSVIQSKYSSPDKIILCELLVSLPILLLFAAGFHYLFERPFLNTVHESRRAPRKTMI